MPISSESDGPGTIGPNPRSMFLRDRGPPTISRIPGSELPLRDALERNDTRAARCPVSLGSQRLLMISSAG